MNSSEEKQVFLLGRILKRDPLRVKNLLINDKLKAPYVAVDFSRILLKHQSINIDTIEKTFNENYDGKDNISEYKRVMQIFTVA